MKKIKTLLIMSSVILIIGLSPFADLSRLGISFKASAAKSGYYTYTASWGKATITGVDTSISGDVVIPDKLGSNKVTVIEFGAFAGCYNIESITIGPNIADLEGGAFSLCSVKKFFVSNDNSILSSGSDGVLYSKDKTTLVAYPVGNSQKKFTIPDGVTSIFDAAFYGAKNLTEVIIPDSVVDIGPVAFYLCTNLTAVNLPEKLETIGEMAFMCNLRLTDITIPKTCKTIEKFAFVYCVNLKGCVIPESVKNIGESAFDACLSLKNISVYSNDVKIGNYAFGMIDGTLKSGVSINDFVNIYEKYLFTLDEDSANEELEKLNELIISYDSYRPFGEIYCNEGSTAEKYAKSNGITYKYFSQHTHSYTSKITKNATCTSTGTKVYTCSCGDTYTKTIAKTGHTYVSSTTKAATCTTSGVKTYKCKCGDSYTKTISKTGHKYKTTTTKATTSKDGKVVKACTGCSKKSTTTIYKIKTIKLSSTKYTYTGKKKTPTVTVTDSKGNKLKKDTDYTLKYSSSSRKSIGNYNVKITFKGKYSGSKTLTFQITPGKVTGVKQDTNKRGLYVYWSKVTKAAGYEIWEYSNGEWRKLTESKECSKYNASVNAAYTKTYGPVKWKIRAYTKVDGKKIYGSFSDVKTFYGVG